MNPDPHFQFPRRRQGRAAFTLVEMMVTMVIFSFVVLAIIGLQLYAMRVYTLGATMLSATTSGRQTMNDIRDHIRAGKIVLVGTFNGTNGAVFSQAPLGALQQGNALEIEYTNSSSTNFLVYYQDQTTTNMYSFSNSPATSFARTADVPVAHYVTNFYCFFSENYQGVIQTNYVNNSVIHVVLQFYQWQFPIGIIGGSSANSYNYYSLNTRIDRRDGD
jgi:prepilin-type N-terminal cleavage/methylation domain-containing protein